MTTGVTIEEIEKEFELRRSGSGFVNHSGGWMQNDALFHAFYVDILHREGLLTKVEKLKQRILYMQLIKKPGLLMRNPDGSGGQESHDNTKATLYISKLLGMDYHKDFLKYGRENGATEYNTKKKKWRYAFYVLRFLSRGKVKYVYNTQSEENLWNESAYHGRFQGMLAQAQILNGENPPWWRLVYLAGSFVLAAHSPKSVEAKTLLYWVYKSVQGHSKIVDWAISYWKKKVSEQNPRKMADVWRGYGWADHPYETKYFVDVL